MKKYNLLILVLLFLTSFSVVFVLGAEPTQQFNKIYLTPFYRQTLSANTPVTYTVNVTPPDRISSVVNAIVSFNIQVNGQTQTLTLTIGGQSCNNANYYIATAFSTTGQLQAYFDCSNIIKHSGTYTLTLTSAVNTGAISGWLDLTYMNNPMGTVDVHGTEYMQGDNGKMFLQLLDNNKQAVNNSECFLNMWYPNGTQLQNLTLMSHLADGIYYRNFIVPDQSGVYPASAKCYIPLDFANTLLSSYVYENWESNSWTDATGWGQCHGDPNCQDGWDYEDTVPLSVIVATGCHQGTFCAKTSGSYGWFERGFYVPEGTHSLNITYWFKFTGAQTNEHFDFFIFDGNWHMKKAVGNAPQYGGYTNGVWYPVEIIVDESEIVMGTLLMGWFATKETPSTSDQLWIDAINVNVLAPNISISNETAYQVLMGSGEAHVGNIFRNISVSFGNISASIGNISQAIWDYPNKSVEGMPYQWVGGTEYTAGNAGKLLIRMVDSAGTPIADANCNATIFYPNMSFYIQNVAMSQPAIKNGYYYYDFSVPSVEGVYPYGVDCTKGGKNYYIANTFHVANPTQVISDSVWNSPNRTLTYYPAQVDMTNYTKIQQDVWAYVNRTLTFTQQLNISDIASAVWNYTDRILTFYPNQTDMTNYLKIQEMVWNNTVRQLTYYPSINLTELGLYVWNSSTRNLTYYPAQVDMTNYSRIQKEVWENINRTLTYYPEINMTLLAENVWNFSDRQLTYFPVMQINNSALIEGIWNYTDRILTYYPQQQDLTNYTKIQEDVWNYVSRNLTYYEHLDMTNYTEVAKFVWNFTDRIITACPCNVSDKTNYSRIQEDVWAYVNRTLTYYPDMNTTQIAEAVWDFVNRNLTYYPAQVDMTNYSRINDEVWAYVNRTLTYYPEINISELSKAVWEYTDRILTFYPDINNTLIAEFVWNFTDRQLTYFPVMQVNNTEIAQFVWNYTDRLLTQCPCNASTIAEAVWNYTSRILTYYPEINKTEFASEVWNYTTRVLTDYPHQEDMTNYTAIFEGVWNYSNRNLTYYPEINISQIAWAVWNYTNRTLTQYLVTNGTCDFSVPKITNCIINDTFIGNGESVKLSCNVTDNMWVSTVEGTVNGNGYYFAQDGDIWHIEFTCNENTTGTYNWTFVRAIDNVGLNSTTIPMLSYSCDFTNFAPNAHIVEPSTLDVITLPYNVTFTASDVNDDALNVSLILYDADGNYNYTIVSDMDATDTSYYWNDVIPYGNYSLVLLACELSTGDLFCGNDTNEISVVECPANWTVQFGSCQIDDSKLKTYTDANSCVNPYPDVPADNGTFVPCNYCSQNLLSTDSNCGDDNYMNRTWVDLNFATCCQVTNISSDCEILNSPYNETSLIFCGQAELMGLADCGLDPKFNLNEKEYCLINMPENYSNETFDCISYVEADGTGEVIQVNPEYSEKSGSVLGATSEEETREYFKEQNGLVNLYVTKKNLQPELNYTLGVQCSSPMRVVTAEVPLQIDYEDMEVVASRSLWMKDNIGYIIAGTILFILVVGTLVWLWKTAK